MCVNVKGGTSWGLVGGGWRDVGMGSRPGLGALPLQVWVYRSWRHTPTLYHSAAAAHTAAALQSSVLLVAVVSSLPGAFEINNN